MYDQVLRECVSLIDLSIYSACKQGLELEPWFSKITGPLLYYTLTHRAWSLYKCWGDSEARERLVPEIVRPEKARSLSNPSPLPWHEIEMTPEYDCRELLDELITPLDDLHLVMK
jgi:hypothetical protein